MIYNDNDSDNNNNSNNNNNNVTKKSIYKTMNKKVNYNNHIQY